MKKLIFSTILLLAVMGVVFAADPIYIASVNVLNDPLGAGDTLTIYGFIDHTTGQGTLSFTSIQLRYYRVGSDPSVSSTYINSGSITYESSYENPDSLLLDGAYYAKTSLSGLSDGTYTVQVLVDGEIKDSDSFVYDADTDRNSTFAITSYYDVAGSLNVDYVLQKQNVAQDVEFDIAFYSPIITDSDGLGNTDSTATVIVDSDNSTAGSTSYSSPFISGVNVFVARVTSTNTTSSGIPLGYVDLWMGGAQQALTSEGSIELSECSAKEETTEDCTFTVTNTGAYPTRYTVESTSTLSISTSFTSGLIQPGDSATGTVSITAVEGDAPSATLTLDLMHDSDELDTVSETITVQPRDLINEVVIEEFEISPNDIREGDEITVSFELENTGDYDERIRVQYTVDDDEPVNYGNAFTLRIGQTKSMSVTFDAPEDVEELNFGIDVLKEDVSIAGRVTTIYIEQLSFTPYIRWFSNYKNMQQGDNTENKLTIRNQGNTAGYYSLIVESDYASLDEDVYLLSTESEEISVPILASENAEVGAFDITATICSLTSGECDEDDFTLTVREKDRDNSTIIINQTLQELKGDEGSVFEIKVQNYEGATKSYSLSTGAFDGELQVSPSTITLMDSEEGSFYLYAKPAEKETQSVTYQVLMGSEVVSTGNLTMSYGSGLITGLITLSEAGSIGAVILGIALIAGLLILGLRSFNQSKVELKYWK
jgi:hypothetical protein